MSSAETTFAAEQRLVEPPLHWHQQNTLKIPVYLNIRGKEGAGYTKDISSAGLRLVSRRILSPGTPLELQFAFGETCHLTLSGQVVFCLLMGDEKSREYLIGVRFAGVREIENKILVSAVQELKLKHSAATQEKSFLHISVSNDTLALEAAEHYSSLHSTKSRPIKANGDNSSVRKGTTLAEIPEHRTSTTAKRSTINKNDILPKQKSAAYSLAAAQARRDWLSSKTGAVLKHIALFSDQPESLRGNIENFVGVAQIPIGVAGPLKVNGQFAQGIFYVPMATTEGALVYTYNQGMLLLSMAGGAATTLLKDELHISPVFSFESLKAAQGFAQWLESHFDKIKEAAEKTSQYGKLNHIEPHILDRNVVVKFCYSTGDTMGINMVTFATEEACKYILSKVKPQKYYLQSNFSAVKKVTLHNFVTGFGKTVVAEALLPGSLVKRFYHITPQQIVDFYQLVKLTTTHAGMIGLSGHTANALEAVFAACGQDMASVVDSYIAVTNFEVTADQSLYVSVKLPGLLVGTVGGGTDLATQRECLTLLGCYGAGHSKKFSEVIAATVLAGELGICARIANGTFSEGHRKYGRKNWQQPVGSFNTLSS